MSKSAVLSNEVQISAVAPVVAPVAATTQKPAVIVINERTDIAFGRAAVLATQGYVFSKHVYPETFAFMGQSAITMVLAKPDESDIAGAAESLKYAQDLETLQNERDSAAALAATEAEQKRLAAKAVIDAELATAQNLVRRLTAAAKRA
jgi:hypothetical protein